MEPKSEQTLAAYTGTRSDVVNMIPVAPERVLDVGCSNGMLGKTIKSVYPGAHVTGIDIDAAFVAEACKNIDTALQLDLSRDDQKRLSGTFDLMVFADVLEHMPNPTDVLKGLIRTNAAPDCHIVISIPNVQHVTVIGNLLLGVWPTRDRGIFDRTHLRWFTLRSIRDLAEDCGCDLLRVSRNYRIFDSPYSRANRLAWLAGYLPFRNFLAYQYLVTLRVRAPSIARSGLPA